MVAQEQGFIHEVLSKISPFLSVLFWVRNPPKPGAEAVLKKYGFINIVIIIQKVVPESFFLIRTFRSWSFNRHFFFVNRNLVRLLNQERKQYMKTY